MWDKQLQKFVIIWLYERHQNVLHMKVVQLAVSDTRFIREFIKRKMGHEGNYSENGEICAAGRSSVRRSRFSQNY